MKSRKVKSAVRSKAYMKKLKGAIPIEVKDPSFDEEQGSSESDEDFLKKEDSSEEEEVLPITDDESDLSEQDAGDEEGSAEEDLPNLDYWGKKKSVYYNADFVDQDRGKSYREEDAEKENAEREAAMPQLLAMFESQFSSAQFFHDANDDERTELKLKKLHDKSIIEEQSKEYKDKPQWEKLEHEKRKYPKLLEFQEEFKEKFAEVNNKLAPLIEMANSLKLNEGFIYYIKLKYQILLHYLLNISFYLYLKNAENIPENHPIYERIDQFKQLNNELNSCENHRQEIDFILENLRETQEVAQLAIQPANSKKRVKRPNGSEVNASKKKLKVKQFEAEEDIGEKDNLVSNAGELSLQDLEYNNPIFDEKRTITYQIAKNKGLVPRRKKEYRNPRVHHRLKFRKAKIRRKGQVREAIKEIKRYSGEPTGISSHVVKSIKLK